MVCINLLLASTVEEMGHFKIYFNHLQVNKKDSVFIKSEVNLQY